MESKHSKMESKPSKMERMESKPSRMESKPARMEYTTPIQKPESTTSTECDTDLMAKIRALSPTCFNNLVRTNAFERTEAKYRDLIENPKSEEFDIRNAITGLCAKMFAALECSTENPSVINNFAQKNSNAKSKPIESPYKIDTKKIDVIKTYIREKKFEDPKNVLNIRTMNINSRNKKNKVFHLRVPCDGIEHIVPISSSTYEIDINNKLFRTWVDAHGTGVVEDDDQPPVVESMHEDVSQDLDNMIEKSKNKKKSVKNNHLAINNGFRKEEEASGDEEPETYRHTPHTVSLNVASHGVSSSEDEDEDDEDKSNRYPHLTMNY